MVGRDVRDVDEWVAVPPHASLTTVWRNGGCTIDTEHRSFSLSLGQALWMDAGCAHTGRNTPGSDFITLFFDPACTRRACLHVAPIRAARTALPEPVFATILHMVEGWMDVNDSGRNNSLPFRDSLLDWVGNELPPGVESQCRIAGVTRSLDLMKEARGRGSIGDIANEVGMSASAFSRSFSRRIGMTPSVYRRQLMLVDATQALLGNHSVHAAAHISGFSDAAHLSRVFKAQYGATPSSWKRQVGMNFGK